jgi:hypothetical protein
MTVAALGLGGLDGLGRLGLLDGLAGFDSGAEHVGADDRYGRQDEQPEHGEETEPDQGQRQL